MNKKTYAHVKDGVIIQGESNLPKTIKSKTGEWIMGFDCQDEETIKANDRFPVLREELGDNQRHGDPYFDEEQEKVIYPALDIPTDEVKEKKLAELAQLRWEKETAGILVDDVEIATDTESQKSMMWLYIKAQEDKNGDFYVKQKDKTKKAKKLKGSDLIVIADAVFNHTQACLQREAELSDLIDADVNIDITTGWPDVLSPTTEESTI